MPAHAHTHTHTREHGQRTHARVDVRKDGATNLKVGGEGVNALVGGRGINTVKTKKIEKGGGCMTPAAPMVAPPLRTHKQKTNTHSGVARIYQWKRSANC